MNTGIISSDIFRLFKPISLDSMDEVSLMDRRESKYVIPVKSLPSIIENIRDSYLVLDIEGQRSFRYNNTYLDTDGLKMYNDHVTGRLKRFKVRYRSYKDTETTFLEVKVKSNKGRTLKYRVNHDQSPGKVPGPEAINLIGEKTGIDPMSLKEVLSCTYNRVTFVGLNTGERITVDYDIRFSNFDGKSADLSYISVIEVKHGGKNTTSPMKNILKNNSYHPGGFSKYCIGTFLLNDPVKKNSLKPKILMLNNLKYAHDNHFVSK